MSLQNTIHDRMFEQTLPKRRGTAEQRPGFRAGRIIRPRDVVVVAPVVRVSRIDRKAGRV